MCQFNLAVVDSHSDDEKLKEVFIQNNLQYSVIKVKKFEARSGITYKIVLTSGNNCNCHSALGSEAQGNSAEKKEERDIKKLKQKKWSEIKIKRYLENKYKTESGKQAESAAELEKWNKTIHYCLNNELTKRFGILIHYFNESSSEEEFDNIGITKKKLDDFRQDDLKKVEFDNILLIEQY